MSRATAMLESLNYELFLTELTDFHFAHAQSSLVFECQNCFHFSRGMRAILEWEVKPADEYQCGLRVDQISDAGIASLERMCIDMLALSQQNDRTGMDLPLIPREIALGMWRYQLHVKW